MDDEDADAELLRAFEAAEQRVKQVPPTPPLRRAPATPLLNGFASIRRPYMALGAPRTPAQGSVYGPGTPKGVSNLPTMKPSLTKVSGKQKPPPCFHRRWLYDLQWAGKIHWSTQRAAIDKFVSWFTAQLRLDGVQLAYDVRKSMARQEWANLAGSLKARWILGALQGRSALPSRTADFSEMPYGMPEEDQRCRGALLTYHGDWGFDLPEVSALVRSGLQGQSLSAEMGKIEYYQQLADRFFNHIKQIGLNSGLGRVSVAVEHCQNGLVSQRVHLHAFLSGIDKCNLAKWIPKLHFEGIPVAHVSLLSAMKTSGSSRRACEGHYYLQFDKFGSLARRTNYPKGTELAVSKRWVFNQWKLRKMSYETAKQELIFTRDGVQGGLRELEAQFRIAKEELCLQQSK